MMRKGWMDEREGGLGLIFLVSFLVFEVEV